MKIEELINKVHNADCIEFMKSMPENSVDSIVCDPPYGLEFMGKEWDKLWDKRKGSENAKLSGTGNIRNAPVYQAGKEAQQFHFKWATECLRVLKPGGYLLSFGGSRTEHRMVVAIEDAGFEIRDKICWATGSGFPKSLNIGKKIDQLQGNERESLGIDRTKYRKDNDNNNAYAKHCGQTGEITKGTSEWEGWGTALKPAIEYICVARKPLSEKTVASNVLKWGTGGINIDESRIPFVSEEDKKESTTKNQHEDFGTKPMTNNNVYGDYSMMKPKNFNPPGRFPSNLILDGSDEVVSLFPNTKGSSGSFNKDDYSDNENGSTNFKRGSFVGRNDSGSASRFFYCAKSSKAERNMGCEELEEKKSELNSGGIGRKCSVEKRLGDDNINAPKMKNCHPTVKPLALMEYLIKLVTPPKGIVLDPFLGSGSTAVAAQRLGFNWIGCEKEKEYCLIAEARIKAVPPTLF